MPDLFHGGIGQEGSKAVEDSIRKRRKIPGAAVLDVTEGQAERGLVPNGQVVRAPFLRSDPDPGKAASGRLEPSVEEGQAHRPRSFTGFHHPLDL